MKYAESIIDLIGNTPLVRINKLVSKKVTLLAKLESFNPLHSVKDRIAMAMIDQAEKEGKVNKETMIIEPTSGNTGIGLAYICAVKNYKLMLTMPETMSIERRKLLKRLGARIELTPAAEGMLGAINHAKKLAKQFPNSYIPQQFNNPANPRIHYETTGPEIWKDTDGKVDIFIAGIGTGGTITGVGRFLKEKNKNIQIIGIEPLSSPVLSGGKPGAHVIQGIGAGFIPEILDQKIIDEIIQVDDDYAYKTALKLAEKEGIFAGFSAGAAVWAAIQVGRRKENVDKTIVTILPDTGERYLSIEF